MAKVHEKLLTPNTDPVVVVDGFAVGQRDDHCLAVVLLERGITVVFVLQLASRGSWFGPSSDPPVGGRSFAVVVKVGNEECLGIDDGDCG